MVLGMPLSTYTQLHVGICLIAIASGLIVLLGMIAAKRLDGLTAFFLVTTALSSITGFLFPFKGITPGIVIGILSIIALAVAAYARYGAHLAGFWRGTYVISAAIALYFNCFILIVQSYQKIPTLHALAPTQTETPFKASQGILLLLFIILTVLAAKKFRVEPARA